VIPGAGGFEIAAYNELEKYSKEVKGRAKLGVLAYANALLVIPETLAVNAGFDANEKIVNLIEEAREIGDAGVLGLNLDSGDVEAINVSHIYSIIR
jgi:T-complex protein 1 subunit zeta